MEEEKLDQIIKLLSEIRTWLHISSYSQAKAVLEEVLNDDRKRLAYQMTDGKTSFEIVRKTASLGTNTLQNLYNRCVDLGLMESVDKRRRRVFDLKNFGLLPGETIVDDDLKRDKKEAEAQENGE